MGEQVTHAPIPRCEDVPCAIRSFGGVDVLRLVRPRTARPARAVCDVAPRAISPKGDMPILSTVSQKRRKAGNIPSASRAHV